MTAAPRRLRVASYNIHACLGMDGHRDPTRIAAVLPLPKKRAAIDPRGFTRRHGNAITRTVGVVRNDGLDACLR